MCSSRWPLASGAEICSRHGVSCPTAPPLHAASGTRERQLGRFDVNGSHSAAHKTNCTSDLTAAIKARTPSREAQQSCRWSQGCSMSTASTRPTHHRRPSKATRNAEESHALDPSGSCLVCHDVVRQRLSSCQIMNPRRVAGWHRTWQQSARATGRSGGRQTKVARCESWSSVCRCDNVPTAAWVIIVNPRVPVTSYFLTPPRHSRCRRALLQTRIQSTALGLRSYPLYAPDSSVRQRRQPEERHGHSGALTQ